MPKYTKSIQEQRKREAIRGVALFALLQLACSVSFLALCFIPNLPTWAFVLFAALAVICILPLAAALVVLKQRFIEIQGGELDAARQY